MNKAAYGNGDQVFLKRLHSANMIQMQEALDMKIKGLGVINKRCELVFYLLPPSKPMA